jgi:hypothetical protein
MSRTSLFLALLLTGSTWACGGSGAVTAPPPSTGPIPSVTALSPNSSAQGGPAFTLSVVGTNFASGSTIKLNAISLPTTFVNSNLVTAAVSASAVAAAGADAITVVNPAPNGATSNSMSFAVPCVIAAPAAGAAQTKARLGAYYFDGWSSGLTNFHFQGLPLGPYQDRQPLSAWQDNSTCAVEQQLAWAHNFGIDFFVFDWYFNTAVNEPGDNLNSALQITHSLPNRHGMQYAILYVDNPPFDAGPTDWTSAVTEWVSYMTDPDYLRINGEPALFIINVGEMNQVFGSSAAVLSAFAQLRAAAQAQGLPGVYIVGGFGVPNGTLGQPSLSPGFSIAESDGYDAVALYGYPFAAPPVNGMLPFSTLAATGQWTWDQAALNSTVPFIPTAMSGWDPRPWDEREFTTGDLMWYSRTPQEVATFVTDAIDWTSLNQQLRPEPASVPPLVLIEAWNEFGEGSYVIPTVGDGTSYGDALATTLTGP